MYSGLRDTEMKVPIWTTRRQRHFFKKWAKPGLFFAYFRPFLITISIIQIEKTQMVCSGFKPVAAGWQAQTIRRSYCITFLPLTLVSFSRAAIDVPLFTLHLKDQLDHVKIPIQCLQCSYPPSSIVHLSRLFLEVKEGKTVGEKQRGRNRQGEISVTRCWNKKVAQKVWQQFLQK